MEIQQSIKLETNSLQDDILFKYGYVQCDAILNRQTDGNLLWKENLRALNDSLWVILLFNHQQGWRQDTVTNQVHIYANDIYEKGENLWFPKKPVVDDKENIIDEDSYKYQIQPVVSFSAAAQSDKIFSNGISPIEIFKTRTDLGKVRDTLANSYATSHLLATYNKHLILWMDGHACKQFIPS